MFSENFSKWTFFTFKESERENENKRSLIEIINQIESAGKELDDVKLDALFDLESLTTLSYNQNVHFR